MPTTGPYRTQQDLIYEVLKKLGVMAAGQAADPEDYNYVLEDLDGIARTLAALEIAYIPDTSNVPSLWFAPLADIVAGECATKFGVTPEDFLKLKKQGLGLPPPDGNGVGSGAAALALKQMNRARPTYERVRAEYF
jgi:hypothetical protein